MTPKSPTLLPITHATSLAMGEEEICDLANQGSQVLALSHLTPAQQTAVSIVQLSNQIMTFAEDRPRFWFELNLVLADWLALREREESSPRQPNPESQA